ncbi:MAG TPA: hypothetical protein VIF15_01130 [Polyangiaceae bacterium]
MRTIVLVCGLSLTATAFTVGAGGCGGGSFSAGPGDDGGGEVGSGEAGADAGGGDAASHWCAGRPEMFCEDFDEAADVGSFLASWSTFEQNGGTFRFDTASAPSPPNALGVGGSNGAQVLAIKTFPLLTRRPRLVRLEFALRINSPGSVGLLSAAGFAAVAYGARLTDGFAAMAIGNGPVISAAWVAPGDAGGDAGAFQTASAKGAFPSLQVWAGRFAIEIDFGATAGAGGCVQMFQGPTALLDACLPLPPTLGDPRVLSIALGDSAAALGSTGNIDLEFDDVTFDVAY